MASFASAALVNCGQASNLPDKPTPEQIQANECKLSDLIFTIERIINFLLSWAWIIAIFYIMWAGYNMMFAAGNSEDIESAKKQFRNAIIGFVLIMASYLLINWIVSLFTGQGDPRAGSFKALQDLLLLK